MRVSINVNLSLHPKLERSWLKDSRTPLKRRLITCADRRMKNLSNTSSRLRGQSVSRTSRLNSAWPMVLKPLEHLNKSKDSAESELPLRVTPQPKVKCLRGACANEQ